MLSVEFPLEPEIFFDNICKPKFPQCYTYSWGWGEGERDIDELCKLPTCDELYGITRARPYFYMFVLLSPRSHFL